MKIVIEITMMSGNVYRINRESKDSGCMAKDLEADFEKELFENEFIVCKDGLKVRTDKIESYKTILASNY